MHRDSHDGSDRFSVAKPAGTRVRSDASANEVYRDDAKDAYNAAEECGRQDADKYADAAEDVC